MVSAPMARTADSSAVGGRNSSGLSSAAVMLGRPPAVVIRSMRRVRPIIDAAALEMLTSERMGHEIPAWPRHGRRVRKPAPSQADGGHGSRAQTAKAPPKQGFHMG